MRVLLDADLPYRAKAPFLARQHDAMHVRDVGLSTAADRVIYHYAVAHRRLLVSRDLGFADVRAYPSRAHYGIVVLRVPSDWTAVHIVRVFETFLSRIDPEHLTRALTIVEPGGYRIRR